MNLAIVIVSWNGKEMLKKCLGSVFSVVEDTALRVAPSPYPLPQGEGKDNGTMGDYFDFKVFVVDNASQDGTPEMVQQEFPQVRLLVNKENLGFAKANNQGLSLLTADSKQPSADYILLLNQDMEVLPGTLAGMVSFMRAHPEAGVAGCHLITPLRHPDLAFTAGEGSPTDVGDAHTREIPLCARNDYVTVPQARRFPGVWDQAAIILKLPHLFPSVLNKYLMKDFDYDKTEPQEVDSLRGSFFMIRREVLEKVGGLDERFFFWFEEVDFCQRVKQAGWKVMYNGAVKCVDLVGQSVKDILPYQRQKMFLQSLLKYFRKWQPGWKWAVLIMFKPIGLALSLSLGFVSRLSNKQIKQ